LAEQNPRNFRSQTEEVATIMPPPTPQLKLPSKESLQEFLDHKRKEVTGEV
jgi:hypothetical protein